MALYQGRVVENWKDVICAEVRALVNLDAFAENYFSRIKNNIAHGEPVNYAVRHAKNDLRAILVDRGVKMHDIAHLLHFCGLAIYPAMYAGCGCHEHLRKNNYNN